MSDQNLGSISAAIRLKIDQLQQDAAAAIATVQGVGAAIASELKEAASATAASAAAMGASLKQMSATAASETEQAAASTASLGKSLGSLGQVASQVGLTMSVAGGAIVGALASATKVGSEWNQQLLHISANTGQTREQTEEMRKAVEGIGATSAAPLSQLADGYMHVSNFGYKAADATKILEVATRAAVATGADASKTSETLAGTLHNFGLDTSQAANIMDMLRVAASKANSTLQQFTAAAGPAFAQAHVHGVQLAEVSGAIETLTQHEFTASSAAQMLGVTFEHIANPVAGTKKELEKLGLQHSQLAKDMTPAGFRTVQFTGFLRDLGKAAEQVQKPVQDLATELFRGKLGGAAIGVLAQNFQEFAKNVKELSDIAEKGASGVWQFAQANTSLAGQIQIVKNNLTILSADIEQALLPTLSGIINTVRDVTKWFEGLPGPVKQFTVEFAAAGGVTLLLVGALATLAGWIVSMAAAWTAALPAFAAAGVALTPFVGWIIGIGAALALLVIAWVNDWGHIREVTKQAVGDVVSVANGAVSEMRNWWVRSWSDIKEIVGGTLNDIVSDLTRFAPVWNFIWTALRIALAVVWEAMAGVVRVAWHTISGIVLVGLDVLSGNWLRAWNDMDATLGRVWEDMVSTVRNGMDRIGQIMRSGDAPFQMQGDTAALEHAVGGSSPFSWPAPGTPRARRYDATDAAAHHKPHPPAFKLSSTSDGGGGGGGSGAMDDLKERAAEAKRALNEVYTSLYHLTHDDFANQKHDALQEFYDLRSRGVDDKINSDLLARKYEHINAEMQTARDKSAEAAGEIGAHFVAGFDKGIEGAQLFRVDVGAVLTGARDQATAFGRAVQEAAEKAAGLRLGGLAGGGLGAGPAQIKEEEDTAKVRYDLNHADYKDYLAVLLQKIAGAKIYSEEWKKTYQQLGEVSKQWVEKQAEETEKQASTFQRVVKGMGDSMTNIFEGAFQDLFNKGWKSFFQDVVKGFTQMLEQMLAQLLAKAAVFGILSVLTGGQTGFLGSFGSFLGFDDWGNDRKAQHWGFDYADMFTRGINQFASQNRPAGQSGGRAAASNTININMHGVTVNHDVDVQDVAKRIGWHIQQRLPGYVV